MEVKTIENRSIEDFKDIFTKEIKAAKKNGKKIIKYGEKNIELITNLSIEQYTQLLEDMSNLIVGIEFTNFYQIDAIIDFCYMNLVTDLPIQELDLEDFTLLLNSKEENIINKIKKEILENCITYERFAHDVYVGIEKATNNSQDDLMRKLSELSLENLKTENIQKID